MAAASIVSLVALTACSTNSSGATADGGVSLDLVAYSTPETAYDEITADFAETPEGDGVEFSTSYGPSGDQSRAVDAVDGDEVSVVVTRTARPQPRS